MNTQNALELVEKIEKVLGFSIYRLYGCGGFIAGRAVYEFVLYKMGKIPSYDFRSFEVYIRNDGASLKREIESRGVFIDVYEGQEDLAKKEVLKNKYPLNIEKVIFDIGGFQTSREFKKFLKTGQLQIALYSCSELMVLEQLFYFEERYKERFFVDRNKELLKLAVMNRNKPYGSKLFPICEEWQIVLKKYFLICNKKNQYFLKTKKEECRKYIPKNRKRFIGYKKHIIEFWDVIYGGASKILRLNYERLKEFKMEHLFSERGLTRLTTQIPEKEILLIKKYLAGHNLLFLVDRDDIEKTFENFTYIKLLEDDYGMEVIGFVENFQQLSIESIHDKLITSYRYELKPMVEALDLNRLKIPNVEFKELVNRVSLKKEGNSLHHCVGGYILDNGRRIISLKSGMYRSTLEISFQSGKWRIIQNRSYCNGIPNQALIDAGNKICFFVNKQEEEKKRAKVLEALKVKADEEKEKELIELSATVTVAPDFVRG